MTVPVMSSCRTSLSRHVTVPVVTRLVSPCACAHVTVPVPQLGYALVNLRCITQHNSIAVGRQSVCRLVWSLNAVTHSTKSTRAPQVFHGLHHPVVVSTQTLQVAALTLTLGGCSCCGFRRPFSPRGLEALQDLDHSL